MAMYSRAQIIKAMLRVRLVQRKKGQPGLQTKAEYPTIGRAMSTGELSAKENDANVTGLDVV
jgi:hypothetical protein